MKKSLLLISLVFLASCSSVRVPTTKKKAQKQLNKIAVNYNAILSVYPDLKKTILDTITLHIPKVVKVDTTVYVYDTITVGSVDEMEKLLHTQDSLLRASGSKDVVTQNLLRLSSKLNTELNKIKQELNDSVTVEFRDSSLLFKATLLRGKVAKWEYQINERSVKTTAPIKVSVQERALKLFSVNSKYLAVLGGLLLLGFVFYIKRKK